MADSLKPQYDELVARWSALAPERREELLAEFVPDYVYNSEKIENAELTYATVKQIVETGSVTDYTGDVQLLIETYNLARVKLAENPCLSEELIQEAQGLVTMGTYDEKRLLAGERPGTFKLENYVGGPASVGIPAAEVPRADGGWDSVPLR